MCSKQWLAWNRPYNFRANVEYLMGTHTAYPLIIHYDISVEIVSMVHVFLAHLWGIKRIITLGFSGFLCTAAMLQISDIVCGLKSPIIEQAQCYIWEACAATYGRMHTLTRTEYTLTLSMLEAGGGCDISKGFLPWPVCQTVWRAVEGLASPRLLDEKASNMCFLWHSNQPLLPSSCKPPPTPFSWGGLPAETGRLIPPCSYPSDKALRISFSSRLLSLFL